MLVGAGPAPGPAHRVVERAAWKISRGSSRRFFLAIAVAVLLVNVAAGTLAAVAAARNTATVTRAHDRGLRVAASVTEFQNHLSLADAQVATTLVSEQEATALGRARYEAEILAASLSLTDAGLVATGRNAEDISALAAGLVRYAGLVETARAYPIGTTFHDLARDQVQDVLVPTADRVRRAAEDEVEAAAGGVTGRWTAAAIVALALALLVLVGAAVLVAGRTRIRLELLLVVAVVGLLVELVVVSWGLWSQHHELRSAADDEVAAFVAADAAATGLFDLRSLETGAVAPSERDPERWEPFDSAAEALTEHLDGAAASTEGLQTLRSAVGEHVDSVAEVEELDLQDRRDEAAAATLEGSSAITHRTARRLAVSTVNRSTRELGARLDSAADGGVAWPLPLGLGAVVAVLAAGGVLERGWDYR